MPSLAALTKPISAHEVSEEAPQGSLWAVPGVPPPRLQPVPVLISSPFRAWQGWTGGVGSLWAKGPFLKNGEEEQENMWGGTCRCPSRLGLCNPTPRSRLPPAGTRLLRKRRWDSDWTPGCCRHRAEPGALSGHSQRCCSCAPAGPSCLPVRAAGLSQPLPQHPAPLPACASLRHRRLPRAHPWAWSVPGEIPRSRVFSLACAGSLTGVVWEWEIPKWVPTLSLQCCRKAGSPQVSQTGTPEPKCEPG